MKKTHLGAGLLLLMVFLFGSCSTDVDLYADFKDITIVYGLLDINKDTNYVKINRAFLGYGDANEIAMIPDSSNYPGKLDAKIIEYRSSASGNNYEKTREYVLDTITIHDKEPGTFYSPDQLVYYTTGKIHNNSDHYKYRYDLEIDRGDTVITASTDIVGGSQFAIVPNILNFSSMVDLGKLRWIGCPNSSIYEIVLRFYYTEVSPTLDSVQHCVNWSLGTHPEVSLQCENGVYFIHYKAAMFFGNLANEIGDDSLTLNVQRIFYEPSVEVEITAGGSELYNYITVNGSNSSIVQTIPEYTNINGGYGVFSSRSKISKRVRMTSQTVMDLYSHPSWNFHQGR